MIFHFHCNIRKICAEGVFLKRSFGTASEGTIVTSLPKDIHGAPPDSLLVKISEVIGSFRTLRKMALFWCRIVDEVSSRCRT